MADTLFISDLHLDPARPAITRLFLSFLASLDPAETPGLFILGDLFEAWVGDDDDNADLVPLLNALEDASARGVRIRIMHGNRDFLLGNRFATRTGCELLNEPARIDLYGTPTLLLHGDTLCTDDHEYQAFRRLVRDPAWQADFLARPLAERRAIAAGLRETSRDRTGQKAPEIMDVNQAAVETIMREQGVHQLIHGHTHRPAIHEFELDGRPARRVVLGDWYEQGSLLRCNQSGCRLQSLPVDHSIE